MSVESDVYDVVVVGAGRAGRTVAVRAASEGLTTLMIGVRDAAASEGRSANRDKLLNDLSGVNILNRAQAINECDRDSFKPSHTATKITRVNAMYCILLDDGSVVNSRAVVVATGAHYRTLDVVNYQRFEYRGIHYAATGMEAALCLGEDLAVVGGGSSAGQAAVFLSGIARHVHLLVRGNSLRTKMSSYLVQRILNSSHITVHTLTEIQSLEGESELEKVTWKNKESGQSQTCNMSNLFVMIGAQANSGWLRDQVELDMKGFVHTGFTHSGCERSEFATSSLGIFAVGDVRAGSIKRVTSAVAEGSAVVGDVHRYLNAFRGASC